MKALISTNEIFNLSWVSDWFRNDQNAWEPIYSVIENCQRVTQVELDNKTFLVHSSLVWVDCPDNCVADQWYFKDGQCFVKPTDVLHPSTPTPEASQDGEPGVIA
jgi:hypothetical protein